MPAPSDATLWPAFSGLIPPPLKLLKDVIDWTHEQVVAFQVAPERLILIACHQVFPTLLQAPLAGELAFLSAESRLLAHGAEPLLVQASLLEAGPCVGSGYLAADILDGLDRAAAGSTARLVVTARASGAGHHGPWLVAVAVGTILKPRLKTGRGAKAGDHLILTRPIGSNPALFPESRDGYARVVAGLSDRVGPWLATVPGVHAMLGIGERSLFATGSDMAKSSDVTVNLEAARLPLATDLSHPAGSSPVWNRALNAVRRQNGKLPRPDELTLPELLLRLNEVNGGLLVAVDPDISEKLVAEIQHRSGTSLARVIGRISAPVQGGRPVVIHNRPPTGGADDQ
ncbi:MAG: hypothetical protein WCF85_09165 [Rhodospirillaceae bacterium]